MEALPTDIKLLMRTNQQITTVRNIVIVENHGHSTFAYLHGYSCHIRHPKFLEQALASQVVEKQEVGEFFNVYTVIVSDAFALCWFKKFEPAIYQMVSLNAKMVNNQGDVITWADRIHTLEMYFKDAIR